MCSLSVLLWILKRQTIKNGKVISAGMLPHLIEDLTCRWRESVLCKCGLHIFSTCMKSRQLIYNIIKGMIDL